MMEENQVAHRSRGDQAPERCFLLQAQLSFLPLSL